MSNYDIVKSPSDGVVFPEYFMKSEVGAPEKPEGWKEWPLCVAFNVGMMHMTEKPKFM